MIVRDFIDNIKSNGRSQLSLVARKIIADEQTFLLLAKIKLILSADKTFEF